MPPKEKKTALEFNWSDKYGSGDDVTSKYRPLNSGEPSQKQIDLIRVRINGRRKYFEDIALYPYRLQLHLEGVWCRVIEETRNLPPLIVISSGRSEWISAMILQVSTNEQGGVGPFHNKLAKNPAIDPDRPYLAPPPLYASPTERRNVYIIVHELEYEAYRSAIDAAHIHVVGFEFTRPTHALQTTASTAASASATSSSSSSSSSSAAAADETGVDLPQLTGFGACRLAAVEFCKELNKMADGQKGKEKSNPVAKQLGALPKDVPPIEMAWILDDNVTAITNVDDIGEVEKNMKNGESESSAVAAGGGGGGGGGGGKKRQVACSGFRGGTGKLDSKIVFGLIKKGNGVITKPDDVAGLLQQCVLWNIDYLTKNDLNFSPIFIQSAEDVSFHGYLLHARHALQYYGSCKVLKVGTAGYDNKPAGSEAFQGEKEKFTNAIVAEERRTLVKVGGSDDQQLQSACAERADNNKFFKAKSDVAPCHVVEQLMSEGIAKASFSDEDDPFKGQECTTIIRPNKFPTEKEWEAYFKGSDRETGGGGGGASSSSTAGGAKSGKKGRKK